ncbi:MULTISPECIES: energy-coupling factor transporter transmembrane component T family protein [Natrialba]|uniref:ABC transporter integral membrane subunit n=1 Tax=Natrialba aegyptia DSM 13077 TaxID=1227491 RepID=M0AP21_9EURY|nr:MULTISPECIES: energy-coupling factor transporter transmembrane component T [Natrialba]ELY99123.1 ABC transporter integral membrane subunit [Natrialba aegyptia DSM 13077]
MSYQEEFRNALSIESLKQDLLRTAYDNEGTIFNRLDPRVLLTWYAAFLVIPWLFYDMRILGGLLTFVSVLAVVSRVSKYLIALLAFGVITNVLLYAFVTVLMGGSFVQSAMALVPYTTKLTIISVTSIAVFSGMSPKNISRAFMSIGIPRQFTFAISYGYRMLPVLIEEYHETVNVYRLRSRAPESPGRFKWRYYVYLIRLSIRAFYPMIFDVAKRSRVTVEALETRGFSHSLENDKSRELQLGDLRVGQFDVLFMGGSLIVIVGIILPFV